MDMETLLQLTDTSLKMGVGAVIAAACGWWMMRRQNNAQFDNLRENRRLQILEEVSTRVGMVSHCFAKYSSLVVESIQFGERWPLPRRQELEAVNTELVNEFRKLADAESRLLMLGEKHLERTLRLYGARIAVYRKQVYVGRQDITPEEITSLKAAVHQVREQFYDMLSRKYDRLLANA